MSKKKVLIVTQEMEPYTAVSEISEIVKNLPTHLHKEGMDVRVLMPRYGLVNERRHRLHEVVRLSGMNIIVDDDDYPLIIKVASLPGSRLQVYFLDNEEFFKRKFFFEDKDGTPFVDNADRMIFFCKGVMETVRKFGWPPDIIHCHGWMTALVPLYLKTAYKNDPIFENSKMVFSAYVNPYEDQLKEGFSDKAAINNMEESDLEKFLPNGELDMDYGVSNYIDGLIKAGSIDLSENVLAVLKENDIPFIEPEKGDLSGYGELYTNILEK